ncbi:MAG: protein phosphatase 2C domain-containing protein, partial [Pseudomonadota bacterium]
MVHIECAGLTDVGKKREGNEDAYFLDDTHRLYVVADGMGGHQAGEVASAIVVETIKKFMENEEEHTITDFDAMLSSHANQLVACLRAANREVYLKAHESEECRGMGSTLAAVYYTDATFIAANVGDSPIYLVRDGNIEQLSVSHTVAAELAASHPERLKTSSVFSRSGWLAASSA